MPKSLANLLDLQSSNAINAKFDDKIGKKKKDISKVTKNNKVYLPTHLIKLIIRKRRKKKNSSIRGKCG